MQQWAGMSLPGDLVLERFLGGDDSGTFFHAALNGRPVVVKLVRRDSENIAAELDSWQRTRQLNHPNLLELLDLGTTEISGETVLYAVFEAPDDSLATALKHSPLSAQEAREVLDAILNALRYLHSQGLVLGVLDAEHVLAVGDQIKLSTDALRPASDPAASAEDIRRLGEFWKAALMPASPRSAEIAAHAADPNLQTRWTLDRVSAALAGPVLPPPHRRAPEPVVPYHFPKWILVGAAGLLLLILALNLRRPAEVATQPASISIPAPAVAAAPPPVATKEVKPAPAPAPTQGKEKWRVIAFTYRTREAASKKVQQINQHHPDLHATIFVPKSKGMYLVALGGPMTHDQAVRIQRTARGRGLPRDLYVQNYE
jgi:hypothetical protein